MDPNKSLTTAGDNFCQQKIKILSTLKYYPYNQYIFNT